MDDKEREMTDEEWGVVEPLLEVNPTPSILDFLTEKDRQLAKAIVGRKGYLGPLGMVETAIVLTRLLSARSQEPQP